MDDVQRLAEAIPLSVGMICVAWFFVSFTKAIAETEKERIRRK